MPLANSSGGGGKAGDVRAGGAYVEISAKDRLSAQLLTLKAKAAAFAAGLNAIGRNVTFIGAAALAPLAAVFKSGLGRAEDIAKGAEELGFTVTQYQRIKFAADAAAVSVEDVLRMPERYAGLMSAAPVLDAGAIKDAVTAQQQLRAASIHLTSALAPLATAFAPLAKGVADFARENAGLVRVVAVGAIGLTAIGVATFAFGKALGLVAVLAKPALALVGALLSPLGLVAGGLAGLAYAASRAFPETARAGKQMFADLGATAADTVRGIVGALSKGDFELALDVACAGGLAAWKRFAAEMTHVWVGFKNVVVDTFKDMLALLEYTMGTWEGFNTFVMPGGVFRNIKDLADPNSESELAKAAKARDAQRAADGKFRDKQIADANKELEAARKNLQEKLALAMAPPVVPADDALAQRIVGVRGAFRTLSDANQQFGGSEGKRTSEQIREMVEQQRITNKLLEEAAKNMRFK